MSPATTVQNFRLSPRLRLCCIHLLRRPCRPFFRRGSSRLGPAVAEPPLLASFKLPWITGSIDRILLRDQPPSRENRTRLGTPRLLRLHPGPPSTQFLLCRFNKPLMQPHLLRPCLVPSLRRRLGVSAPQPLCPRCHHRQKSSSLSLSRDSPTPIGRVNNARNRFVTPPSGISFFEVPRSSPAISSFTWRLTNALRWQECALQPKKGAFAQTTMASYYSCGRLPSPVCPDKPGGWVCRLLHDEPTRIYVPLLVRPWIMHACHANVSCHLGVARTFSVLERFYWWTGVSVCTRWWLRRCLQCQVRKSSRQTVRWPIIPLPLPSGPDVAVSVDCFTPLPVASRGNSYILLFTDRFSRRAAMYAVSAAEFTAEGTADILVNRCIPRWGCPSSLLSDCLLYTSPSPRD